MKYGLVRLDERHVKQFVKPNRVPVQIKCGVVRQDDMHVKRFVKPLG